MKYVYFNPSTMQVEAEFDTPNLAVQANWVAKGLLRAVLPDGMEVTRNHRLTGVESRIVSLHVANIGNLAPEVTERMCVTFIPQRNPEQADHSRERAEALVIAQANAKLDNQAGLTVEERIALGHKTIGEVNADFDRLEA